MFIYFTIIVLHIDFLFLMIVRGMGIHWYNYKNIENFMKSDTQKHVNVIFLCYIRKYIESSEKDVGNYTNLSYKKLLICNKSVRHKRLSSSWF